MSGFMTSNRITKYTNLICFKHLGTLHWKIQHWYDKRLGSTRIRKSMMRISSNREFWKHWDWNRKWYPMRPPFYTQISQPLHFSAIRKKTHESKSHSAVIATLEGTVCGCFGSMRNLIDIKGWIADYAWLALEDQRKIYRSIEHWFN